MSTSTPTLSDPASKLNPKQPADPRNRQAWIAKAAKQPMVLETVDLGPLGSEDVEVAVDYCGLCHSDLSALNNDWGNSHRNDRLNGAADSLAVNDIFHARLDLFKRFHQRPKQFGEDRQPTNSFPFVVFGFR